MKLPLPRQDIGPIRPIPSHLQVLQRGVIHGQNLSYAKIAFSRFSLGNRQNLAVVANDDFSRQGGKMAEKMRRQGPTSDIPRNSKLQNAFWVMVIEDSLVLGSWSLVVARGIHALPIFCHSVKKSAFICEICGSNPIFNIKKLSQKAKNNPARQCKVK